MNNPRLARVRNRRSATSYHYVERSRFQRRSSTGSNGNSISRESLARGDWLALQTLHPQVRLLRCPDQEDRQRAVEWQMTDQFHPIKDSECQIEWQPGNQNDQAGKEPEQDKQTDQEFD